MYIGYHLMGLRLRNANSNFDNYSLSLLSNEWTDSGWFRWVSVIKTDHRIKWIKTTPFYFNNILTKVKTREYSHAEVEIGAFAIVTEAGSIRSEVAFHMFNHNFRSNCPAKFYILYFISKNKLANKTSSQMQN